MILAEFSEGYFGLSVSFGLNLSPSLVYSGFPLSKALERGTKGVRYYFLNGLRFFHSVPRSFKKAFSIKPRPTCKKWFFIFM